MKWPLYLSCFVLLALNNILLLQFIEKKWTVWIQNSAEQIQQGKAPEGSPPTPSLTIDDFSQFLDQEKIWMLERETKSTADLFPEFQQEQHLHRFIHLRDILARRATSLTRSELETLTLECRARQQIIPDEAMVAMDALKDLSTPDFVKEIAQTDAHLMGDDALVMLSETDPELWQNTIQQLLDQQHNPLPVIQALLKADSELMWQCLNDYPYMIGHESVVGTLLRSMRHEPEKFKHIALDALIDRLLTVDRPFYQEAAIQLRLLAGNRWALLNLSTRLNTAGQHYLVNTLMDHPIWSQQYHTLITDLVQALQNEGVTARFLELNQSP